MDDTEQLRSNVKNNKWFSSATLGNTVTLRKIVIKDENNFDNILTYPSLIQPAPPGGPKRSQPPPAVASKSAVTMSNTLVDASLADRMTLLETVNSMVETGLKGLSSFENEYDLKMQRLEVYKNAFQYLIDEFNIYRPFLRFEFLFI